MLIGFAERATAITLLLVLLPLIVAAALVIRARSPGPLIIRSVRERQGGEHFEMLKIRTMYEDGAARLQAALACPDRLAEWQSHGRIRPDPRVIGRRARWIRSASIDELPQLWNVARGDMALVGPRPLPPEIAALLPARARAIRRTVRPGLTGLWQVMGRDNLTLRQMAMLDCFYVRRRSLGFDMIVLARTIPAVLSARGAS